MYNSNIPSDRELPSTVKLVKSTILATIGAAFLLVGVVMPAEYGIDPLGVGKMTGLQKMGEIKMSLANEARAEEMAKQQAIVAAPQETEPAPAPAAKQVVAQNTTMVVEAQTDAAPVLANPSIRQDTTTLTLQPNEGNEIKVDLKKGEVVKFIWSSDAGKANFDVHADSKELKIDYHGYGKGSSTREEGTIEAAFDGSHGWFWRNRSGEPLTITLQTEGPYTKIKRVK
jgi:hypothetical protein